MRKHQGEGIYSREQEQQRPIVQVKIGQGRDGGVIGRIVAGLSDDRPNKFCLFANGQHPTPVGTEIVVRILRDTNSSESGKGAYIVEVVEEAKETLRIEEDPNSPILFGVKKMHPVKYYGIVKKGSRGRGGEQQVLSEELQLQLNENETAYHAALERLREAVKDRIPQDEEIPPVGMRIQTPDIDPDGVLEVSAYVMKNGVHRDAWHFSTLDKSVSVEEKTGGGEPRFCYDWFAQYGDNLCQVTDWASAVKAFGTPQIKMGENFSGRQPLIARWNFDGKKFDAYITEATFAHGDIEIHPMSGSAVTRKSGGRVLEQDIDLRAIGVNEPRREVVARAESASTDRSHGKTDLLITPAELTSLCPPESKEEAQRQLAELVHSDRESGDSIRSALSEARGTKISLEGRTCEAAVRLLENLKAIQADQFRCELYDIMSIDGSFFFNGYAIHSAQESLHNAEQFYGRIVPDSIVKLMDTTAGEFTKDQLLHAIAHYTENIPSELPGWRPSYAWKVEPSSTVYDQKSKDEIAKAIERFFDPIQTTDIKTYKPLLDRVEADILKPHREAVAEQARQLAIEDGERSKLSERTKELTPEERTALIGEFNEFKAITIFLSKLQGAEAEKIKKSLPGNDRIADVLKRLQQDRIERTLPDDLRYLRQTVDGLAKRNKLNEEHKQLERKIQELLMAVKTAEQTVRANEIIVYVTPEEEVIQTVINEYLEALPESMANNQNPEAVLSGIIERTFE